MLTSIDRTWYGWNPDIPDFRDFLFKISQPVIPQTVYLKDKFKLPEIFNQGQLGSCTANGISFALGFLVLNGHFQNIAASDILPFSRLFIYYNERVLENSISQDAGAQIRDGFKAISSEGACPEILCPYDINIFAEKPSDNAYTVALNYKTIEYTRLDNANKMELIQCLLDGFPFVFGFSVYSNFESQEMAETGVLNIPANTDDFLGGHCVVCVGYNLEQDRFLIANSWGTDWAQDGYFTMPAEYLTNLNLASDFWTAKTIL